MPKKTVPKKTVKPGIPQKERFIEYAKEIEADETGERFEAAMGKVAPPKDYHKDSGK